MSKQSEAVKKWRVTSKSRIIEAMGGSCIICGYNKCHASLALHHIDPSKKSFSFGAIRANPTNWDSIVLELRKCVLLCQNCHNEFHADFTPLPQNPYSFNEEFTDYKSVLKGINYENKIKNGQLTPCKKCATLKPVEQKYCSVPCRGFFDRKVAWKTFDLETALKTKTISQISRELGCSCTAIKKRMRKLKLTAPNRWVVKVNDDL